MRTDSLGSLLAIVYKGANFMTSCFLSCTSNPFRKGSTLKGKNLLPLGAKFVPFTLDPFQKGFDFEERI